MIRLLADHEKISCSIDDRLFEYNGMPSADLYSPEPSVEKLAEHYEMSFESLHRQGNGLGEKVAAMNNIADLESNKHYFDFKWLTAIDAIALRKKYMDGQKPPYYTAVVVGGVRTSDGCLIVGTRGGEEGNGNHDYFGGGKLGIPPTGAVTFDKEAHPDIVSAALLNEFKEELGDFPVQKYRIFGYGWDLKASPGLKFFGEIQTSATLEHIRDMNRRSNEVYNQLREQGVPYDECKNAIAMLGLSIDGWEHREIIGVRDDVGAIREFLQEHRKSLHGTAPYFLRALLASRSRKQPHFVEAA